MLRRIVSCIILFVVSLSLTGCLDIVEEIDLKSNGSGSIQATLNLSKSKTKASSLMMLDQVNGIKIPSKSKIQTEINTIVKLLKQTPGISNVSSKVDFTNFIASIKCDFTDVKALNAFTTTLSNHFKVKVSGHTSYAFDSNKKAFTRNYKFSPEGKKEFGKLNAENQNAFKDAYYTSIYRFTDPVKNQENTSAKVSPNKKAVMLKTGIVNLINGQIDLSNRIQLN
ncbi:hypothetical protein [Sphingobacterium spiritivorum]|uniref:Lipoprotein n=1 Tax=Sphingobacterium spiritivorum ATCC 33861 TaxID=525373 RepID=D7VK30_SPHSI|nr:hypothetical protein [Sphingobacterium spiritivorum]EFK58632.1 hypothetical protein HMPREF0766_11349 [Sphingobacterium spiritivorum ATCC 33861]QQT34464.1 hypothetical protein I6J01_14180 [Sphingobacterium spiritivorum]WQD35321.1 hypothetical protein U0038_06115 [Sphingobacterium spiritivorum]SUI99961.1 Uncharacterised protein [Sphingobacterium spiritivorum]